jgi:hypothetical protein
MKEPAFSIGKIAPTPGLVSQFFTDSTGTGEEGEIDTRGPWTGIAKSVVNIEAEQDEAEEEYHRQVSSRSVNLLVQSPILSDERRSFDESCETLSTTGPRIF